MPTGDLFLAIDNGTQSVRALVFDAQGALIDRAGIPLQPPVAPRHGWAEQDPDYFWDKVCATCQTLWQQGRVKPDELAGLAITTQRGTVVNLDAAGKPLRPAILWMDQRRTEGLAPIRGLWGAGFRLRGATDLVARLQADAEANWIKVHQPDIWRKTHKFLLLSGYLTYRFCGHFVDSVGAQVGYLPFDYKRLAWSNRWDWKWQSLPIRREQLPDLRPPAAQLGQVTREAAAATGLPAGLPIIAGGADKACEVLGTGALEPHVGCLSFGTSATVNITCRKYMEIHPPVPPYPAAVPHAYNMEVQVYRGFWLVNWFKEEFGLMERQIGQEIGVEPETLLDELLAATLPGAAGLMLQPYWAPGLRMPGPEAKGAVIGFHDGHTRAHLYRAVIEGLTYALREGGEEIQKRTGTGMTELRVAGGGSQSDAVMQVAADVFGLPAARPHTFEASGLGAAIDAAVGLGAYPDFTTAVAAMTHPGRVFQPNPANHRLYNDLYRRIYLRMYQQLKPLYHNLQEIIDGK